MVLQSLITCLCHSTAFNKYSMPLSRVTWLVELNALTFISFHNPFLMSVKMRSKWAVIPVKKTRSSPQWCSARLMTRYMSIWNLVIRGQTVLEIYEPFRTVHFVMDERAMTTTNSLNLCSDIVIFVQHSVYIMFLLLVKNCCFCFLYNSWLIVMFNAFRSLLTVTRVSWKNKFCQHWRNC